MKLLSAVFFCLFLFVSVSANAVEFEIFGGLAIPVGDFGSDSGENAGLATTGISGGLELGFPLNPELQVILSGNMVINGVDLGTIPGVTIENTPWINIPMMTGLKYQADVADKLKIYGLGIAGLNLVVPPIVEAKGYDNGDYYILKQEYDAAISLALGLGVGMIISDLISLSGRFYYMGNPEFEGTLSLENGVYDSVPIEAQQSMAVIMFTAGFVF